MKELHEHSERSGIGTDFVKNKAVKRLNIVQSESGKYQIVVNLTWKEGEWNLVTTRKTIREWASRQAGTPHS